MLASGVVGGLALFSLILMTTVVVFGIKFLLDRNMQESEQQENRREAPPLRERERENDREQRPLYVVKQPRPSSQRPPRKRAPARRPRYEVVPSETVYTLEPVEREPERTAS